MDNTERCDKHPSIPKAYCSCTSARRNGTPTFSMIAGRFEGNPVVEILKNGGPIHRNDQHFVIGVRKAEMLLACVDALKEFGWGSDAERAAFRPRIVQEGRDSIRVSIEHFTEFVRSTGELVNEPFLRLEAINRPHLVKGLGVMKCRAVWALRDHIGDWLAEVSDTNVYASALRI